jgi:photosystem II stability/assembly factor-like uncharacterized protein
MMQVTRMPFPTLRELLFVALACCLFRVGTAAAQTDNTWVSGGPAGQTLVRDIVIDPVYPDTVYAATSPGTIYRSLDRGGTWTQIGAAIGDAVNTLAVDPLNTAVIYAGTQTSGIYKTSDRGSNWASANTGLPDTLISALEVDPVLTSRIFAGTSDSLFVSTDSGASWSSTGLSGVQISSIAIDSAQPDTLYVSTDGGGVYRTYDGGATWLQRNSGLGTLRVMTLAVHPSSPERVYAGTLGGGVYRSTNRGDSWVSASSGLADSDIATIAITPENQNTLYAGSTGVGHVYKSSDAGDSWVDLTRNLPLEPVVDALAVRPDSSSVLYVGIGAVHRMRQVGLDSITVISTGADPRMVASADLDADGALDLIVADGGANTVSVFLTRDSGALFLRTDYRTGSGAVAVSVGDLDGDGDLDIVSGNSTKRTISVLFNDSTGTFSLPVDFFVGAAASAVALADLDSDGDLDVAVGDSEQGDLRIYLNDGRGSFEAPAVYGVAPDLSGLLTADLTGNGLPDLVALSRSQGTISVLANQGNALLEVRDPLTVGTGTFGVTSGDFDLDGDVDLAVLHGDGRVSVLHGNGAGEFEVTATYALPSDGTGITAADVDQDQYADLLVPLESGEVRALVNDGGGAFGSYVTMGDCADPGSMAAADVSGDGVADLAVTRPGANVVQVLRNDRAQSIKPPAVPRAVAAVDRGGDLGGNIDLTWDRPRVDETTGRITRYLVYRSAGTSGLFSQVATIDTSAAHSIDSTRVYRAYTDSSATVSETYSYYVRSENAAGDVSAGSDTVSAVSRPQPFFDFVFSGNSPFHVLDTVTVQARLNPIGNDIQSFSLFLDYDPLAFEVLDADPTIAGTQPVAVDSALAASARVLQNRLDASGTGKVNYGLGFLPEGNDVALPVGTVSFVALKDTLTQIQVVFDTSTVRRSGMTARADGQFIQPYIPPPSVLVVRNFRVRGQVNFQGRAGNLDIPIRFDLAQIDSLASGLPLPDSVAYRPPNDMDLLTTGVQTVLESDGGFWLLQVPPGRYGLFAKSFHYLRGRVATDSIVVNDSTGLASTVSFEWLSEDSSIVSSSLRAGDANDDNRADLADFGILAASFGASGFAAGSAAWGADFNGDGVVNLVDFTLLQSNFGERGLGLSVPAKPVASDAVLAMDAPQEDGSVVLTIGNAHDIAGFAVDVSLPAGSAIGRTHIRLGTLVDQAGGDPLLMIRELLRDDRAIYRIAVVLRNPGEGLVGSGALLHLDLPEGQGGRGLGLENPMVLDVSGVALTANALPVVSLQIVETPLGNALLQNVPNPFNPTTAIPFAVATPDHVTLRIFSPLGQQVRTLLGDRFEPGFHRATWDGCDDEGRRVASGVYIYRVSIGNWTRVRKLLLLR